MIPAFFSDQAAGFATSNRDTHADQLLTAAVREGIAAFQVANRLARAGVTDPHIGLTEAVATRLLAAATSAENVLGPRRTAS